MWEKGKGWGGPAKGPGRGGPARPFGVGNKAAVGSGPKKVDRLGKMEAMEEKLFALAMEAADEKTQVSACVALMNRIDGLPVAKQEISGKDGAPLLTGITVTFVDPDK